jgi:hypothetical protein
LGDKVAVKRFAKASVQECRELLHRLHGRTLQQLIGMFGAPAREIGPRTREDGLPDGQVQLVELKRTSLFHDVSPTIHRLFATERGDGKFEYHMQGKETGSE